MLSRNTTAKVAIRRNADGEVRFYDHEGWWDRPTDAGHSVAEYMWTDGNYACDCNRHLFFERAGGVQFPAGDHPCGETLYTALYAEMPDGTRIQLDDRQ